MSGGEIMREICCDGKHEHPEVILPETEKLYDLAELFKVFGDSTRVRILFALHNGKLCVCDIAKALDMTVSAVSHQLRVLKNADLVRPKRSGKTVFYELSDSHVKSILSQGMEHVEE